MNSSLENDVNRETEQDMAKINFFVNNILGVIISTNSREDIDLELIFNHSNPIAAAFALCKLISPDYQIKEYAFYTQVENDLLGVNIDDIANNLRDELDKKFTWIDLTTPRQLSDSNKQILYHLIKNELNPEGVSKLSKTKSNLRYTPLQKTIYSLGDRNYLLSNSIIESKTFKDETVYYLLNQEVLGKGGNAKFVSSRYQIKLNDEDKTADFTRVSRGVKVFNSASDKKEARVGNEFSIARNKFVGDYEQSYDRRKKDNKGHTVQPLMPKSTLQSLLDANTFANLSDNTILHLYKKMMVLLERFNAMGYTNFDFQNPLNVLMTKDCRNIEYIDFGFAKKGGDVIKI